MTTVSCLNCKYLTQRSFGLQCNRYPRSINVAATYWCGEHEPKATDPTGEAGTEAPAKSISSGASTAARSSPTTAKAKGRQAAPKGKDAGAAKADQGDKVSKPSTRKRSSGDG